jgi:triacylglycerol lipase
LYSARILLALFAVAPDEEVVVTVSLVYDAYRDYSKTLSALLSDPIFQGDGITRGQQEAVLLIPGFIAGDWTFNTMSRWLRQIGYDPHLSGISINIGCPQRKVERMHLRLEEIAKNARDRIIIMGHSLGGLVGCALARQRPDLVRQVIAIGSPLRCGWQAVQPEVRPALFAIHSFFQSFIEAPEGCGTEQCSCAFSEEALGAPLPAGVRFTSIYSRRDGIVDWKYSTTDHGETYEVGGLHTDLVVNVEVYRILSNLLAGYPREVVKMRSIEAAAAAIRNGLTASERSPADARQLAELAQTYSRNRGFGPGRDKLKKTFFALREKWSKRHSDGRRPRSSWLTG